MLKVILLFQIICTICNAQYRPDYQPVSRGGHIISGGQYQNQPAPQQQNFRARPSHFQPQGPLDTSASVTGNIASNVRSHGGGEVSVNSVLFGSRSSEGTLVNSVSNAMPGSEINVIGNRAENIDGGYVNSFIGNP